MNINYYIYRKLIDIKIEIEIEIKIEIEIVIKIVNIKYNTIKLKPIEL